MAKNISKNWAPAVATLAKILLVLLLSSAMLACKANSDSDNATKGNEPGPEAQVSATKNSAEIPADQTLSGGTPSGDLFVVATPTPNPIPFQKFVEFDVRVYQDAEHTQLAEGVELDQVRPMMPAHGHGMKTKPEIEKTADGVFRVHGLKFHMKGEGKDGYWTLEFLLRTNSGVEMATFDIQCCRA